MYLRKLGIMNYVILGMYTAGYSGKFCRRIPGFDDFDLQTYNFLEAF